MYEFGPLRLADFMALVRSDRYPMFRRLEAMTVSRTAYMESRNKAREEAYTNIWRHFGRRMMVAVKILVLQFFNTPYAFCNEVAYVRRVKVLLDKVLHGASLLDEVREP